MKALSETRVMPAAPVIGDYETTATPLLQFLREGWELARWCGGEAFLAGEDPRIVLPDGREVRPGETIVRTVGVVAPALSARNVSVAIGVLVDQHAKLKRRFNRVLRSAEKSKRLDGEATIPPKAKRKYSRRVKPISLEKALDRVMQDRTPIQTSLDAAREELRKDAIESGVFAPPVPDEVGPVEVVAKDRVFVKGCNCKVPAKVGAEHLMRWQVEYVGPQAPVCLGCRELWKVEVGG